jgi:hypothetical protein
MPLGTALNQLWSWIGGIIFPTPFSLGWNNSEVHVLLNLRKVSNGFEPHLS